LNPTPKQWKAWKILTDLVVNELTFGGGAGGGKTYLACAWLTIMAEAYPGSRWMIGRRELKRLKQSVLVSLFDFFVKSGYVNGVHYKYNSTDSKIVFSNGPDQSRPYDGGSEFVLMDLAPTPSDPNYERLGSLEFTGGFIEEASEVAQKAKEVVFSRIRYRIDEFGLIPKLLMTCNPHKGYLYIEFYKPWKAGKLSPDKAFIRALVQDNPHISPHYIKSLKKLKDKVLRARLLLGDWEYADDDLSLFIYDAITDMFTKQRHENDDKTSYLSCDVARFGADKAVIMRWEGLRVVEIKTYEKSSMPTLETEILVMAQKYKIPMSRVIVDEGGIGGGVVDHLKCKGFVSNAPPIEEKTKREMRQVEYKVNYQNLRTQCTYELAECVNDRLIAIETDSVTHQNEITEELEQIKARDVDKDVKFKIISKDDIKATLGRSPDFADTLMMRMYFEVKPERKKAKTYGSNPLI